MRAYLRRAIENEATRLYARRRVEVVTGVMPERADSSQALRSMERALDRRSILKNAPESWTLLLFYVDIAGFSVREASSVIGITTSAGESVLHRARSKLRKAA